MNVQYNGAVAIIDLRDRISRGEHPRQEILQFVSQAETGTVIEIHLPQRAERLVAELESIGISSVTNPLGDNHFRLMCVRM
ncbi:amino acid decarboxylase [Paenibacillus sp. BR2-3]|uniref:amino acid decarboxylase n=1 Tax=Paenibacillus sp. BR2-3 TaxID=3048494 RepID=UPI0039779CBF